MSNEPSETKPGGRCILCSWKSATLDVRTRAGSPTCFTQLMKLAKTFSCIAATDFRSAPRKVSVANSSIREQSSATTCSTWLPTLERMLSGAPPLGAAWPCVN